MHSFPGEKIPTHFHCPSYHKAPEAGGGCHPQPGATLEPGQDRASALAPESGPGSQWQGPG